MKATARSSRRWKLCSTSSEPNPTSLSIYSRQHSTKPTIKSFPRYRRRAVWSPSKRKSIAFGTSPQRWSGTRRSSVCWNKPKTQSSEGKSPSLSLSCTSAMQDTKRTGIDSFLPTWTPSLTIFMKTQKITKTRRLQLNQCQPTSNLSSRL